MKFLKTISVSIILFGCKPLQSKPLVMNGIVVPHESYPSVVLLSTEFTDDTGFQATSTCTGTAISHQLVLTAAHCINTVNKTYWVNSSTKKSVAAENFFVHPNYNRNKRSSMHGANPYDIAVIVFNPDTFKDISPLATKPPSIGDTIQFIGFGRNNQGKDKEQIDSTGVKRVGTNKVLNFINSNIYFEGIAWDDKLQENSQSSSAPGDSGGPLFFNNALAGICSGGPIDSTTVSNYYPSIFNDSSLSFLKFVDSHGYSIPNLDKLEKAIIRESKILH